MINKKLLSTTAIALCMTFTLLAPSIVLAQQGMSEIRYYDLTEKEVLNNLSEWEVFLEYHTLREPCQNYQAPPEGFVVRNCKVYRIDTYKQAKVPKKEIVIWGEANREMAVIDKETHTIHFGFDQSVVTNDARRIIRQLAAQIKEQQVDEVFVLGFASTVGDFDYNYSLSERRAKAVTEELVSAGVKRGNIKQTAYGQTNLAIETRNGVRMPENRRVIINFDN